MVLPVHSTSFFADLRSCTLQSITLISLLAFAIIGCLGAAGVLPGSTMGWCAIGLGTELFLSYTSPEHLEMGGRLSLIGPAVIGGLAVLMGGLGVAGIVSGTQIGWSMIGPLLPGFAVITLMSCAICGAACLGRREQLEELIFFQERQPVLIS